MSDMTDEELGQRILNHVNNMKFVAQTPGTNTYQWLGSKIRELLAKPVATREEVKAFCEQFDCRGAKTYGEIVFAALSHFSAPPRAEVPSVEEIMRQFAIEWDEYVYHQRPSIAEVHARTAHAMMQRMAPRPRMQIEGLNLGELMEEMAKGSENIEGRQMLSITRAAHNVYRLANTPAVEDDPDREAKELAWEHAGSCKYTGGYSDPDGFWRTRFDEVKDFWRAVARRRT